MTGDNLFKEFIVVYKQIETIDVVEINGRSVRQRSYTVEAQPETFLLATHCSAVLSVLAVWYSHRIRGAGLPDKLPMYARLCSGNWTPPKAMTRRMPTPGPTGIRPMQALREIRSRVREKG